MTTRQRIATAMIVAAFALPFVVCAVGVVVEVVGR